MAARIGASFAGFFSRRVDSGLYDYLPALGISGKGSNSTASPD
jgi:hypothetical protein